MRQDHNRPPPRSRDGALSPHQGHQTDHAVAPLSPMQAAQAGGGGQANNIGMALQMHAWAQVQSAYYMAQGRPRMVAACRQRMLDECKDMRFAMEAVWAKPVGKDVKKGLGIRFAEAAAQCWTNLKVESTNICETEDMRILRTTVTDLESNVSFTRDTAIEKFVIRKKPPKLPDGQVAKVASYNNYGEAQYRVRATADDMLMVQGKELSKTERLLILKHIPKHIQDDCKRALHETLAHKTSRGDRKLVTAILDDFAEIKVSARQLETYLGHDPEVLTGIEMAMLKGLFFDLADNRVTFNDALAARQGERSDDGAEAPPPPARRRPRAEPEQDEEAPPPRGAAQEREDSEWQSPTPQPRRSPPPRREEPVEIQDDDAGLSGMDLESLDNLVDEDGQPLQRQRPDERRTPPSGDRYPRHDRPSPDDRDSRDAAPSEPMSRTKRVLHALPTRSSRGR